MIGSSRSLLVSSPLRPPSKPSQRDGGGGLFFAHGGAFGEDVPAGSWAPVCHPEEGLVPGRPTARWPFPLGSMLGQEPEELSLELVAMKLWLAVAPLFVQQTSTFKQFTKSSWGSYRL